MKRTPLFTAVYAASQGLKCEGTHECYWCGGACSSLWRHDDPPPPKFVRIPRHAAKPGNLYVCMGCWHWRLPSRTVKFISIDPETRQHPLLDRKQAKDYSWFVTPQESLAVRLNVKEDVESLYHILLNPPLVFGVALKRNDHVMRPQRFVVNENDKIDYETEIRFNVNDTLYTYTVYELEEGLRKGATGKLPGVAELIRLLGPFDLGREEKKQKGSPKKEDREEAKNLKKTVR